MKHFTTNRGWFKIRRAAKKRWLRLIAQGKVRICSISKHPTAYTVIATSI